MRRMLGFLVVIIGLSWPASGFAEDHEIRMISTPTLSPDGQTLVFSWRRDLWTAASAGGAATPLTHHQAYDHSPLFSPDGKSIAFISDRSGANQVYTMPSQGGAPKQLTFHSEGCSLHSWFPDGQSLLVSGRRDHFWRHATRFFKIGLKAQSGEQLLFDAAGRYGSLSPDGKGLLFTREGVSWWRKGYKGARSSQIWHYDLEGRTIKRVIAEATGARSPLWHPDGESFYYLDSRSGHYNLWQYQWSTETRTAVTKFEDDHVVLPCVSADGKTLVFRHLFDLYRLRSGVDKTPQKLSFHFSGDFAQRPEQRRVLSSATEVAFSPDGLELAFIAGGDVWVMDQELREPKQVTKTAGDESDLCFSPDGQSLLFVSDKDSRRDIWRAQRSDQKKYWWQNDSFNLKALTEDEEVEGQLSFSPDGETIAYRRGRGDLYLMNKDGQNPRKLVEGWREMRFSWSPDSRWITYSQFDNNFNRDIFIISTVENGAQPYNLSCHPDTDDNPVWSPDGKMIAFVGRRVEQEWDIYYVYLRAQDDQQDDRDRRLKKALKAMKKRPKKSSSQKSRSKKDAKASKDATAKKAADKPSDKAKAKAKVKAIVIDFEGLRDRIHRVSIPNSSESGLFWSPDSKRLAFSASVNGKAGTYTLEFPKQLRPRLLTSQRGSQVQWLKNQSITWLVGGQPAILARGGKASKMLSFRVRQKFLRKDRYAAAFDQAWRVMRDSFYDGSYNNKNWTAIRRKYRDMASMSPDHTSFERVVCLMLGELNASHLGFRAGRQRSQGLPAWSDVTAHLGVRFVQADKGPGWLIRDVLPEGPATKKRSLLKAGERILAVDGQAVDPDIDRSLVLNGRLDRNIRLRVQSGDKERMVTIRPISYRQARALLYEHWVAGNRKRVEQGSKGRLGYVHIRGMNWPSFLRFEEEIYKVGAGKDGLVIDVRENGGGFTTDHLLTILCQPKHAVTVPRGGGQGYPQGRKVYASWSKPIVVLCNQNSFSNAEIFSHAIKTLKRGKLVGVRTAGGVISTGGRMIMDIGFIRVPFRGWFVLPTGEDMELNGAEPDIKLWPEPGEWPRGDDSQLDQAITTLLKDLAEAAKQSPAKLRKASERKP